uniref:Uncharacterized protein n=1 Tax=Entomoneis paludosa TaxID=265537 RepID=A0A6U3F0D7_9STRA|mmetsp:Transcript_9853/g.20381  ORF Transcript_9853/g.20381 Transcript_9853/m.20381 type:complete len:320 (+) Transcript_9853:78-1037(+)|eukprot:CAMPEP_0172439816 /NCGR_PEP_ID=MMETSP1065-20121228/676_1 /TAXON_ID=265537 /ORGANISM="Amphiprora paludosa, Strain CCMP125" /LENGTH=319 /DNA_ID=CAMNT_0013188551 /DNA_START=180 /DNA_END=1139 /DNA_ORIENTATION=+
MELKMQSLMDSLCRCFGEPMQASELERFEANQRQNAPVPATPDGTRRTQNMKLQDRQWDALFDCNGATNAVSTANCVTPSPQNVSRGKPPVVPRDDMTVEQAQAVAKAKLAANGAPSSHNTPKAAAPKRKRATPDDIFRSKKNTSPPRSPEASNSPSSARPKDAFSRFLTNNPVLANSLCFATPIRGSQDEGDVPLDSNSVVSDTNTLNTAEDTITSTLYYEQVKLAGLKQKNPPMPLFGAYEVKANDDIRNVATSDSYSSLMMQAWVRQNPEILNVQPMESERLKLAAVKEEKSKKDDDDDIPPDMVGSSSESTGRSV